MAKARRQDCASCAMYLTAPTHVPGFAPAHRSCAMTVVMTCHALGAFISRAASQVSLYPT